MVPAGILPIPDTLEELAIIQKTGVLFVSSAELPGADTFIHTLIMRNLDRSRFDVHVAYSAEHPGARTPAFEVLETIPNLHLKPFNFGPSLSDRSGIAKTAGVWGSLSTLVGFAGLARYVRKHNIRVIHSTDRPRDAVSCAVLGKLSGAKSVIHAHLRFAEWMGRGLRWSMARVDAIATVSEFVAQSLVDNGYARAKTHALLERDRAVGVGLPAGRRADPAGVRHTGKRAGHLLCRAPVSRQGPGRRHPGDGGDSR